jgi:hypothetical protein
MKLVVDGVSERYKGNVWGLRNLSLQFNAVRFLFGMKPTEMPPAALVTSPVRAPS